MMKELEAMIDSGQTEEQIIAAWAEKYGYTVLSSPPASGFNMLAYILPFAALLFGALIAVYVARTWKSTVATPHGPPIDSGDDPRLKKVEEELRKFTPED
jgi:cytochrome c-type biogenesis protein CcmH